MWNMSQIGLKREIICSRQRFFKSGLVRHWPRNLVQGNCTLFVQRYSLGYASQIGQKGEKIWSRQGPLFHIILLQCMTFDLKTLFKVTPHPLPKKAPCGLKYEPDWIKDRERKYALNKWSWMDWLGTFQHQESRTLTRLGLLKALSPVTKVGKQAFIC